MIKNICYSLFFIIICNIGMFNFDAEAVTKKRSIHARKKLLTFLPISLVSALVFRIFNSDSKTKAKKNQRTEIIESIEAAAGETCKLQGSSQRQFREAALLIFEFSRDEKARERGQQANSNTNQLGQLLTSERRPPESNSIFEVELPGRNARLLPVREEILETDF